MARKGCTNVIYKGTFISDQSLYYCMYNWIGIENNKNAIDQDVFVDIKLNHCFQRSILFSYLKLEKAHNMRKIRGFQLNNFKVKLFYTFIFHNTIFIEIALNYMNCTCISKCYQFSYIGSCVVFTLKIYEFLLTWSSRNFYAIFLLVIFAHFSKGLKRVRAALWLCISEHVQSIYPWGTSMNDIRF